MNSISAPFTSGLNSMAQQNTEALELRRIDPTDHIGLVRREVRRWTWAFCAMLSKEDLEQEGMKGVIRAAETYDPSQGKFSTYAAPWIRHFIQREVHYRCRHVRVPMNRSKAAYKRGESISLTSTSLDEPVGDEGGAGSAGMADVLGFFSEATAGSFLEEQDRKELVAHLLSTLSEREQTVLRMRFFDDMTLHETGRALHLSRERTRQIQVAALEKISQRLLEET